MFCQKCGKENEEGTNFCLYCGAALTPVENASELPQKNKKKKKWLIPLILIVVIIGFLLMCLIGGNENSDEAEKIISKLEKMTTVSKKDDMYLFTYKDKWFINYNENAQTVRIKEPKISDCLENAFGNTDIGCDGTFCYNWNDNEFYSYIDTEENDKKISIVQYSLKDKKWTLMLDDGWHNVTKDFKKYLNDYGILDIMEEDVKAFKEDLATQKLTEDDLKKISFEDVVNYYKDHKLKSNTENTQEQEESESSSELVQTEDIENKNSEDTQETNGALDYETPFEQKVSFYLNNDKEQAGEMQLTNCYQDYDTGNDRSIIVVEVHIKNVGSEDIDVGYGDFSMYGDNKLLKNTFVSNYDIFSGTISPGREIDGTVIFEGDPLEYNVVELEFAGVTIPLRNDKVNVFQDRPEEETY